MDAQKVNVSLKTQQLFAKTLPTGATGVGISDVTNSGNHIVFHLSDGSEKSIDIIDWWFGTRNQYNALTAAEKKSKELYFIEEGT